VVRGADLLTLVDVRCPAEGEQERPEQLRRRHPVPLVVAEPGDDPGLVVVREVQCVPAVQLRLPPRQHGPEVVQLPVRRPEPALLGVDADVLEVEDRVQRAVRADVLARGRHVRADTLPDGRHVPPAERLGRELLQVLQESRPVGELVGPDPVALRVTVRQPGGLRQEVDHVQSEAVDAAVQPPVHHVVDRLPDGRHRPV